MKVTPSDFVQTDCDRHGPVDTIFALYLMRPHTDLLSWLVIHGFLCHLRFFWESQDCCCYWPTTCRRRRRNTATRRHKRIFFFFFFFFYCDGLGNELFQSTHRSWKATSFNIYRALFTSKLMEVHLTKEVMTDFWRLRRIFWWLSSDISYMFAPYRKCGYGQGIYQQHIPKKSEGDLEQNCANFVVTAGVMCLALKV
jgi:hypothetical protein